MTFAGLDEAAINTSVNIFPNPAQDYLNVSWQEKVELIEVSDSRGRVLNRFYVDTMNETQINLSQYSKGVYFVHVSSEEGRSVHSFVKE